MSRQTWNFLTCRLYLVLSNSYRDLVKFYGSCYCLAKLESVQYILTKSIARAGKTASYEEYRYSPRTNIRACFRAIWRLYVAFIILQIFFAPLAVLKTWASQFSWDILSHVTHLDQSRASENIWWVSKFPALVKPWTCITSWGVLVGLISGWGVYPSGGI